MNRSAVISHMPRAERDRISTIFTERLWRTIKYEEVYLKEYASPKEARRSPAEYLDFYNYRQRHQSLDYETPASLYYGLSTEAASEMPAVLTPVPPCCGPRGWILDGLIVRRSRGFILQP